MRKIAKYFRLGFIVALLVLSFSSDAFAQKMRAVGSGGTEPVQPNVPRCYFTDPLSINYHPAISYYGSNYDATTNEDQLMKPGQTTPPTTMPSKNFTLRWFAVKDRVDDPYKFDYLNTADGYTATLSSNASGDGITALNVSLASPSGTYTAKIKNTPIIYTVVIKQNGTEKARCSVNVKHSVNWMVTYKAPDTAVNTGNKFFPYTLKSITGKDYMTTPFPTATQYSLPIKKFVGRYVDGFGDGYNVPDTSLIGMMWVRLTDNGPIQMNANKVYALLGSTVASWNKNDFINRVSTEPLKVFQGTVNRIASQPYKSALIPWDDYFYPDYSKATGWVIDWGVSHAGSVMSDLVLDDRGYIYLAHPNGIGIVKDDGTKMRPVSQIMHTVSLGLVEGEKTLPFVRQGSLGGNKITNAGNATINDTSWGGALYIFKSGTSYYLLAHRGYWYNIYNVTDPLNPQWIRNYWSHERMLQSLASFENTVATIEGNDRGNIIKGNVLKIYNSADFVAGLAPKKEFSSGASYSWQSHGYTYTASLGEYRGLVADKVSGKFYSIHYSYDDKIGHKPYETVKAVSISVFTPGSAKTAESYTETKYNINATPMGSVVAFSYNNGYLAVLWHVVPTSATAYDQVRIWIFKDGKPVELTTNNFGKQYSWLGNLSLETIGGKDYLFIRSLEKADVYELEPISGAASATSPAIYTSSASSTGESNSPTIGAINGPTSLRIGERGTWTITASDPNSDNLTWSVNWGFGRSKHTCETRPGAGTSQNITYTISNTWITTGTKTVKVYADDCKGGVTTKTFTVTVGGSSGGGGGR